MEMITEPMTADFAWRERDGVRALVSTALEAENFPHAFSTRLGGVSPLPSNALNLAGFHDDAPANIHENRRRFLRLFDGEWRLVAAVQVHGAEVYLVREDAESDTERADALATNVPKILLGVKTADCVPVLLGDRRRGAIAAVHAGWRGTLARIVPRAIERLREEYGTEPRDLIAALGPAALGCCYEVGHEVCDAFRKEFSTADDLFTPTRAGHARIDLHRANRDQLLAAGLSPSRIHAAPFCTMCRTDLFFSYRREKNAHGRVGRLLSVIGRRASAPDS